jgi:hypothetical protein
MKVILMLFLVLTQISFADSNKKSFPICSTYYLSSIKTKAEKMGAYDKFKHCAVSCMLALRCPASDVLEIGILKELADLVGPGNAEMEDLQADFLGVEIVLNSKAKTDENCKTQCDKIYPRNKCQ